MHDLSMTSTQGSAITYVTGISCSSLAVPERAVYLHSISAHADGNQPPHQSRVGQCPAQRHRSRDGAGRQQ
jgi:hypothetical protein